MSLKSIFASLPTAWPAFVICALAVRVAFGSATILASEYFGWLFVAVAPVFIARLINYGLPSQIAKVLYEAERADTAVPHAVPAPTPTLTSTAAGPTGRPAD